MSEEKFTIEETGLGIYINHNAYPGVVIAVFTLKNENCYQGGLDDIFDFFVLKNNPPVIYQLLIDEYHEVDDVSEVSEDDLPDYKRALRKCWKWLLHRYLIGSDTLPRKPEHFSLSIYDDDDERNDFSFEKDENGTRWVYHRVQPLFRVSLKKLQDPLGIAEHVEFLEEVDPLKISSLLRKLGDWLATTKFPE